MWRIRFDPGDRRLTIWLREIVHGAELRAFSRAHAAALEATGGLPFTVFLDLRGLYPLDTDAAAMVADVKRVAAQLDGYRGRAVLVDSPTIAMQQRNATYDDGGDEHELITLDPQQAEEFVAART
ncbi:MAG: hypothetical protein AB7S26_20115 [Sandaracinaceae bacterium]